MRTLLVTATFLMLLNCSIIFAYISSSYEHSRIVQIQGQQTSLEMPYRFQVELLDELSQPYTENISWNFTALLSSSKVPFVPRDRITLTRPEPWLWEFEVRFEKLGDGNYSPYYTINAAADNGWSLCAVAPVIVLPGKLSLVTFFSKSYMLKNLFLIRILLCYFSSNIG